MAFTGEIEVKLSTELRQYIQRLTQLGLCSDRKHWGRPFTEADAYMPAMYRGFAPCARMVVSGEKPEYAEAAAIPDYDDQGNGDVYTTPDFGCVQWEPRAE